MSPHIYIISGLGADERVFCNLNLKQSSFTHLKWIAHNHNETIAAYALRLCKQITHPNPTIIGLSFGGMMAIEISRHIPTEKIILISSAKTIDDLPWYYHFVGKYNLHKLVPNYIYRNTNLLTNYLFGIQSITEKRLLKSIMKEADMNFTNWAIDKIVHWENVYIPENVTHIHGTNDHILPLKNCDYEIEKGGHLMILNHAEEINILLKKLL